MTQGLRTKITPREWAILMVAMLSVLLAGFFSIPVMDRDEARYAQASSQMMETGDYIDIKFQEQDRHVKPVGIYWMQVATAAPFGGADAPIWAFRLPSLFGILIAVGVTAWLGARIIGAQGGLVAGGLLGLTLMAAVEARTAKTDAMLLAAGIFAQAALFYLLVRYKDEARPKFVGAPLIFWAATGAALIIKGPIVTMVSATTIAAYGLWTRDWGVLRRLRIWPGFLVTAAIALPWLIAINIVTDWGFLEKSVGHALLGKVAEADDSHGGPIGYHTLLLPLTFWPGSLFIGLAGALAWVKRHDPTVKFLICWLVPTWVIFEFVQTKLPHYIFPTFPALAILAAWGVLEAKNLLAEKWPRRVHIGATMLFVLATALVAALPLVGQAYINQELEAGGIFVFLHDITGPGNVAIIFGALTIAAGIAVAMKPDALPRLAMLMAVAIGAQWAVFQGAFPGLKPLWPSHEVSKQVATLQGCDDIIATTAGYREPSNVRHLGTQTFLANTGAEAAAFLQEHQACGVAIIDRAERASFDAAMGGQATQPVGFVSGLNTVKGDVLDLDILVMANGQLSLPDEN